MRRISVQVGSGVSLDDRIHKHNLTGTGHFRGQCGPIG